MKFSVSGESNSLNWWNRFQPVRVSSKQFEARTSLNYGPILNAFSVLSAIASSTSASSFIGEYATTTRYTQRSVEKTCSPQVPDLGQSNTCDEGTFDHDSTCDITCDATGVTIEQTCSCYTSWGPIMMPRPDCIWEGQTHSNCVAVEDTKPNVPVEHSRGIEDFANIPVWFKKSEIF